MNFVASTLTNGAFASLRQPARDLGLADAGRPDHQDVLRRDFLAQRLAHLHAPPAVAQRDGDGALGGLLADDVLVELLTISRGVRVHVDLTGCAGLASRSSSMTRLRLV